MIEDFEGRKKFHAVKQEQNDKIITNACWKFTQPCEEFKYPYMQINIWIYVTKILLVNFGRRLLHQLIP